MNTETALFMLRSALTQIKFFCRAPYTWKSRQKTPVTYEAHMSGGLELNTFKERHCWVRCFCKQSLRILCYSLVDLFHFSWALFLIAKYFLTWMILYIVIFMVNEVLFNSYVDRLFSRRLAICNLFIKPYVYFIYYRSPSIREHIGRWKIRLNSVAFLCLYICYIVEYKLLVRPICNNYTSPLLVDNDTWAELYTDDLFQNMTLLWDTSPVIEDRWAGGPNSLFSWATYFLICF